MKLKEYTYNRDKALIYSKKWALSRNPQYYNFDKIGGDCTNFVSQCLYAGCGVMNSKKDTGWYYYSLKNRSPSWTSVALFYNFLINNKGVGPYGHEASSEEITVGDYVQLATQHDYFHHTGIIVEKNHPTNLNEISIACHTYDFASRPLGTYLIRQIRFIKIDGFRANK